MNTTQLGLLSSLLLLSSMIHIGAPKAATVTISVPMNAPEIDFALGRLERTLSAQQVSLAVSTEPNGDISLHCANNPDPDCDDGFSLRKDGSSVAVHAQNNRGLMYGILELVQQLDQGQTMETIQEKAVQAHFPFRAIKFNLPWYSYRSGENLALHTETCRDLKFWEAFLDMMVENKFNTLSLWNMHPYIYMVRPENFPEASPFSETEMAEWQAFWRSLFKMAKRRGINTYVVNWNIFVSGEFAKHYGGAEQAKSSGFFGDGETSPAIEKYTRELITQTINEYDDLTGIGLTLGERMGGMNSAERADWIDRTIIAGLKAAKRKARLIYRAPLSANRQSGGSTSVTTERITRNAIETMELEDDVWIEFKFNWSHGHSSPRLSIVHGGMLTDTYWEPLSDKYKAIWTLRNEDFFVLRWAQPDFIREFIRLNSQAYAGGCFIGSECYIPAKDYITQEQHRRWDYAFQRQWLFYKVWGNLLFDPDTPDRVFARSLEGKFRGIDGTQLLEAWKLASNCANGLGSFYQGTWDGTLYSEGFAKNNGKLIGVNELIKQPTLDENYISIDDYVNQGTDDPSRINPLQLADQLDADCQEALRLVAAIQTDSASPTLLIELNDIVSWAWHGQYFAQKLRGGVALARYRKTLDKPYQQSAVNYLTAARRCWLKLVEHVEKYNKPVIPYQFDPEYSWRKQLPLVEQDINIACKGRLVSDYEKARQGFRSDSEKTAFLKALESQDARYDPVEKMIRRPFSSPGYHTTLKGGYVHPTRDSLNYAVALLDSAEPDRLRRACDILRRVIALQDQNPQSRTYGIWSWFMEEPLTQMAPPDWNWADFCGTQLLQVAIDHMDRLPSALQAEVKDAILHAANSVKRRNVGPGYTNIAIMGTYVTLVTGELFGQQELLDYGKTRLKRFYDYTHEKGSFSEYNSPTYTIVATEELTRMLSHIKDPQSRQLIEELNRFVWRHIARHFHAPTKQWSGPNSRSYRTFLRPSTYAFIQRATAGHVKLVDEDQLYNSINAQRLQAKCPEELFHYFTRLDQPRLEIEAFVRNPAGTHDIIGTTFLTPDFTLGSVNIGDLWNQRRPLLAYWNTDTGQIAMRLRCLHDGYDYSSASLFTVQDKNDILGLVTFATDRGDTHISLDRLKDASITANDLRLRLEFEGDMADLTLPTEISLTKPNRIQSSRVTCDFSAPFAVFAGSSTRATTGRSTDKQWLDIILYQGEEKRINFADMDQAAVAFTLSLTPTKAHMRSPLNTENLTTASNAARLTSVWRRPNKPEISITFSPEPTRTTDQKASSSAKLGEKNPWKHTVDSKPL